MNPLELVTSSRPGSILSAERTYAIDTLLARAARVAERLLAGGNGGERGIVSLKNGPDFFAGLVGTWMAGAQPVLLDPMVKQEVRAAIDMTGARFVVSDVLDAAALPDGIRRIAPDGGEGAPGVCPEVDDEAPILFLFTSGSTGKPTLVPKTFSQIDVEVQFISTLFDGPKRVATLVPWCHIWGILSSFFVPLSGGGVCDLSAGVSARTVLDRVQAGALDLVVAVPAYYQAMVRLLEAGVVGALPPSCYFASSSAPMTPVLRKAFTELTGCRLTDIYGSTEAGGIAFRHADGPWTVQPHVDIRVDGDGALSVRSPSVSFETENGFYSIGDLVKPTENGFLLVGRKDDVVKIGGRRIALGEIQAVFDACPAVLRAAVFSIERRGALRLAAVVQPAETGETSIDAIKQFVRERLADHKVPGIVRLVDEMPLTSSGKIARRELEAFLAEPE